MSAAVIATGVLALVVIGVFAGFLWGRRAHVTDKRAGGRYSVRVKETSVVPAAAVAHITQSATPEPVPEPNKLAVRMVGVDTALVFGNEADIAVMGTKVDSLPNVVAHGIAVGNAALQGVLAAGSTSGQLVRLTAESAAALRAMGPVMDSSGAILGVVRDGGGQFAKILRFTSVERLSVVASLGPALTSIALQMQLQAISKQLQSLQRKADSIGQHQVDQLASSVETNVSLLARAYDLLQRTGTISDSEWHGLAGLTKSIEDNVREIAKKIDTATSKMRTVSRGKRHRWAGDRMSTLDTIDKDNRPLMWVGLYVQAQRAVIVGEYLRVHRFIATNDPHLEVQRLDSEKRVNAAIEQMRVKFDAFDKAVEHAGSGDLSSWNPSRNGWNDKRPALNKHIADMRAQTRPVLDAVRAQAAVAGGERASMEGARGGASAGD